jgi:hypothetical protein
MLSTAIPSRPFEKQQKPEIVSSLIKILANIEPKMFNDFCYNPSSTSTYATDNNRSREFIVILHLLFPVFR